MWEKKAFEKRIICLIPRTGKKTSNRQKKALKPQLPQWGSSLVHIRSQFMLNVQNVTLWYVKKGTVRKKNFPWMNKYSTECKIGHWQILMLVCYFHPYGAHLNSPVDYISQWFIWNFPEKFCLNHVRNAIVMHFVFPTTNLFQAAFPFPESFLKLRT